MANVVLITGASFVMSEVITHFLHDNGHKVHVGTNNRTLATQKGAGVNNIYLDLYIV